MMLSTMEMENNLKLSVHEMLFKLHLKRQIITGLWKISKISSVSQKTEPEDRGGNPVGPEKCVGLFSRRIWAAGGGQHQHCSRDKRKIQSSQAVYRREKLKNLKEKQMNAETFTEKKKKGNLNNLRVIGRYLTQTLDEHQRILSQHFYLKKLYDEELENYSNMTLVQRFPVPERCV